MRRGGLRWLKLVVLALFLVPALVVHAQAAPDQVVIAEDGSLWLVRDGVRHRLEPAPVDMATLESWPEGEPWESNVPPVMDTVVPAATAAPAPTAEALGTAVQYPPRPEGLPQAQVARVVDGDTVDVLLGGETVRLRLIGIDTPEVVDPRTPVQCFGREASARAHEILDGQSVWLEADPSQGERDRYGRLLRYVWLPDGRLFNLLMIAEGYAHEYTFSVPYRYQQVFRQAQALAREQQLGLWAAQTCAGDTSRPADTATPAPAMVPPMPVVTSAARPASTATPAPTVTSMPRLQPVATATPAPTMRCDAAYPDVCIPPPPPDLNCADIPYRNFRVLPPDPHGFDRDRDGIGCESR